jgi:hypothetical protein
VTCCCDVCFHPCFTDLILMGNCFASIWDTILLSMASRYFWLVPGPPFEAGLHVRDLHFLCALD